MVNGRTPRMGDHIHFCLYYPEEVVGQERAGLVAYVHPDNAINLVYLTGGQPFEPDNQPYFTEYKIQRYHDATGAVNTWHYSDECPNGL